MTLINKDKDWVTVFIINVCFVIFAITLFVSIIAFEKYDRLFSGHWENWTCSIENQKDKLCGLVECISNDFGECSIVKINITQCNNTKIIKCKQVWVKDE